LSFYIFCFYSFWSCPLPGNIVLNTGPVQLELITAQVLCRLTGFFNSYRCKSSAAAPFCFCPIRTRIIPCLISVIHLYIVYYRGIVENVDIGGIIIIVIIDIGVSKIPVPYKGPPVIRQIITGAVGNIYTDTRPYGCPPVIII